MDLSLDDVATLLFAAAALAQFALVAYLAAGRRIQAGAGRAGQLFLAAIVCGGAWAAAAALGRTGGNALALGAAALLDVARQGLWFGFLLLLVRPSGETLGPVARRLPWLAAACVGAATAAALWRIAQEDFGLEPERWVLATQLAMPLCGLLLVEQLFRKLGEDERWSAKPVCLGLGCLFVFDLYLSSEALLFGRFDADALSARSAATLLAVPFLALAARRHTHWMARLQVSRAAAFHSATLVLSGGYLLFMSAVGYYVRYFGGTWGRALQISLLVAGLALLGALLFSGSVRAWLRVFVGKHFFRYRYDYREEWLRFTAMLSHQGSPQEVGQQIVRGLANMVECPAGSLWTRSRGTDETDGPRGSPFTQTVRWNVPPVEASEPADSPLCGFLRDKGWVVDLLEFREQPSLYGELALPTWLLGNAQAWVVVPLLAGDELMGFVLLAPPRTRMTLDWEVRDLLKTAARQAAGYLARMQATEALLEARKFEAFNRMSAFVVHDLKNIVTQLSLMLKNAERLRDNREFQQDMLLTVESSLEKMRRLMLQLREGATPPGGSRGVELIPLVRRLQQLAAAQGRTLEVRNLEKLATRGHEDRLERVLGHLVQNALDATPPGGQVWVAVARFSGQVTVEVGDTGIGMSEDFVKTRLFKPFSSNKAAGAGQARAGSGGMGIGSFESYQYIRELGGSIDVTTAPGQGTRMLVRLPVFEVQQGGDLLAAGGH
jgi:putative PEP-CTERM system histidine kinase